MLCFLFAWSRIKSPCDEVSCYTATLGLRLYMALYSEYVERSCYNSVQRCDVQYFIIACNRSRVLGKIPLGDPLRTNHIYMTATKQLICELNMFGLTFGGFNCLLQAKPHWEVAAVAPLSDSLTCTCDRNKHG